MAPRILIVILAVIGGILNGVIGFFVWGVTAMVALLLFGCLLRKIAPFPKITLIDAENQIYSVKKGLQVQPCNRDPNMLFFRCWSNGELTHLSIVLNHRVYSIDRPIGLPNPGPVVSLEPYGDNEVVSAIANYFVDKNDVWLLD